MRHHTCSTETSNRHVNGASRLNSAPRTRHYTESQPSTFSLPGSEPVTPVVDQVFPSANPGSYCNLCLQPPIPDRAIRLPAVLKTLGISKSCWYSRLDKKSDNYDPMAPRLFKLGAGTNAPSAWSERAIQGYLHHLQSCSDKGWQ